MSDLRNYQRCLLCGVYYDPGCSHACAQGNLSQSVSFFFPSLDDKVDKLLFMVSELSKKIEELEKLVKHA